MDALKNENDSLKQENDDLRNILINKEKEIYQFQKTIQYLRNENSKLLEKTNKDGNNYLPKCVICQDNDLEVAFLPCAHFCTCLKCFKQLDTDKICIICKSKSDGGIKVFVP